MLTDEYRARISLWQGIKFAFGNFLQTFGLVFLLFIVGTVAFIIYNPIANSLTAPNVIIVIMLFVLQQIYIFYRMMLRLTLYSSQLHLYNTISSNREYSTSTLRDDIVNDINIEGVASG